MTMDRCELCNKLRTDDNYLSFRHYEHNFYKNLIICETCVKENWNVCDSCGDYFDPNDTPSPDLTECKACYELNKEISMEQGINYEEIYLVEIAYWLGQLSMLEPDALSDMIVMDMDVFHKLCHMVLLDAYETDGSMSLPDYLVKEVDASYIKHLIRTMNAS